MTSVVHVLDPRSAGDEGVLACAASLRDSAASQRAVLFADHLTEQAAWAAGICTTQRVSRGLARRGNGSGMHALRQMIDDQAPSFEAAPIVQCWCPKTLVAAHRALRPSLLGRLRSKLVCTLLRPPEAGTRGQVRQLRAALADTTLCCFDSAIADAFAPLLPSPHRRARQTIRLLEPPAPPPPPDLDCAIDRVRSGLGIRPDEPVISLLADPPERGDAMRFAYMLGVAHASGLRAVGLARAGSHQSRRAARFLRSNAHRWEVLFADCSLAELILASDIAICDTARPEYGGGPTAGVFAFRFATSAGVPVVATPKASLARLLGPFAAELTGLTEEPSGLLPPLLRLFKDPEHRSHIAGALANTTRSFVVRPVAPQTLGDLWHELAGDASAGVPPATVGSSDHPLIGAAP